METYRFNFESSRELFEAASDAVRDAERCRRQLEAMEQRALSVSSPSFDARVSGGDHDRLGRDVAALVDREAELHARIEQDYDLIDAACAVLYGRDNEDGVASLLEPWVADAMWHHYLGLRTWEFIAELLCISSRHIRRCVCVAFELMDANGMVGIIDGHGMAEG